MVAGMDVLALSAVLENEDKHTRKEGRRISREMA